MKKVIHKVTLLVLSVLTVSCTAQTNKGIALFDGKSLDKWRGSDKVWSLEEGCIVGTNTAENPISQNTFLIYETPFSDFELTLQYKIVGGNSGVQYRARVLDEEQYVVGGYQADIEAGTNYSGILYEEKGRGILALRGEKIRISAQGEKAKKQYAESEKLQESIRQEEWNTYRIVAKGNTLQHYINGQLMSQVIDDEQGKRADEGIIALQVHQGPPMKVYFKDIYLKEK